MKELARSFMELFAGLERAHGLYTLPNVLARDVEGKQKGKAQTKSSPVTLELWKRHLKGDVGLGIVPIRDDNTCGWGAIDIDSYDGFDLGAFEEKINKLALPLVLCRSKSGGAHCLLFTTEPVRARLIREKLAAFAAALGYPSAEVFPKQDRLHSEADIGNWINMPYHLAAATVRYAIRDGKPLSAEEFLAYAESRKISPADLKAFKVGLSGESDFSDAPPCLQYLTSTGFPKGSMNRALFNMGVYARLKYGDDWRDKVSDYNQRFMGPGTYQEVQAIIRSLTRKNYTYQCKEAPIAQVCAREECYTRKYGLARPQDSGKCGPCVLDEVDRPIVCHMPVPGSNDEPYWTMRVGGQVLDVTIAMVMDQRGFLREWLKRFQRLALPVKDPVWAAKVNELFEEAEVVELPPDAGPEGQLMQHLEQFCTRSVARAQEELILGKTWTCEHGITWFRSKDFMRYLDQQHFREFKEKQIWAIFARREAKHQNYMVKGKCVATWGFPAFAEQTEDFTIPAIPPGEEF